MPFAGGYMGDRLNPRLPDPGPTATGQRLSINPTAAPDWFFMRFVFEQQFQRF